MTTVDDALPVPAAEGYRLSPSSRRVFIGLMLGMLVASVSQTIVGPAMPRIVAELGGMDHYSWVATAAMLVSAIVVPIVGKLSDLYGRRGFYIAGLIAFMIGSVICGLSPSFWVLVFGRAVQGLGMGTLMPLSQTIIGDIIPPRQRGKYQGLMGAVFGVASVAGPIAGGLVTDHFGWRWLFFVTLPVGLFALFVIARFLHLEHQGRDAKIDFSGMLTLSGALVALLLATSWGGTTYPWSSGVIVGLYAVGAVLLLAFVLVERRAEEPVIPLRLFKNSIFTCSNIAAFGVAMVMFGSIIYIPVYAQGVIGVDATSSGLILMPLMLGLVVLGIASGLLITKTGRYKEVMLVGVIVMGAGVWLLTRLDADSTGGQLTLAMLVLGIGLGMTVQQYTLVVQNASLRQDLGVATASTQFFRNVGSTVGIAVFGTVMTGGLAAAIARHLPAGVGDEVPPGAADPGAVLDPETLAAVPPQIADAIREGLADQLHNVFLLVLPIVVVIFLATLAIRVIPLRDTLQSGEDAGRELLDTLNQSAYSADEVVTPYRLHDRTRERILGTLMQLLSSQASREDRPLLQRAVSELGDGDLEWGRKLLDRTAILLTAEDEVAARVEKYAAIVADRAKSGVLGMDLVRDLAEAAKSLQTGDGADRPGTAEPTVAARYEAVDVTRLRAAGNELTAVLLVDLASQPPEAGAESGP